MVKNMYWRLIKDNCTPLDRARAGGIQVLSTLARVWPPAQQFQLYDKASRRRCEWSSQNREMQCVGGGNHERYPFASCSPAEAGLVAAGTCSCAKSRGRTDQNQKAMILPEFSRCHCACHRGVSCAHCCRTLYPVATEASAQVLKAIGNNSSRRKSCALSAECWIKSHPLITPLSHPIPLTTLAPLSRAPSYTELRNPQLCFRLVVWLSSQDSLKIGRAVAICLVRDRNNVVISHRSNVVKAQEVVDEIHASTDSKAIAWFGAMLGHLQLVKGETESLRTC